MRSPAYQKRFLAWLDAAGMQHESCHYQRPEAAGEVQAYVFTPALPPRGRVVYAHATGNDALFPQLSLFRTLLEAGLEVFTFDLDGHGRQSTTELTEANARSSVAAALAEAHSRPPLPTHLIGQSLGGALALAAALDGAAICSLTLVSAPLALAPGPSALATELTSALKPAFYREMSTYGIFGIVPAMGPVKRQAYPVRLGTTPAGTAAAGPQRRSSTPAPAFAYVDVVARLVAGLDLAARAHLLTVPTQLVYGDRDRIVPMSQAQELARLIPHAALALVPGATHYTTLFERGVASHVAAFIGEHS